MLTTWRGVQALGSNLVAQVILACVMRKVAPLTEHARLRRR